MSRTIATILNLKDLFSPQLQQTVSKTKEFQKEIQHAQNNISGFKSKVTSTFSSLKSSVVGFGLGLASGLNMQSMITSAQAGQQAAAQLTTRLTSTNNAVGLTKKQLTDLAASESSMTTYTKGANIATENLLLTFTNIKGGIFKQALGTVNDMSTALGQDTKSSAIQLGKALNDPITGITALSRVGVNFSDSQKSTIKSLVETGQTAKAQQVILQELNKEFGGSAKAAGETYTGVITRIKNTLTGLGGQVGSIVVPYMSQFATTLSNITPIISSVISTVVTTATPLISGIVKDIGQIATNLMPSLGGSTKNLEKTIQSLISNGLGAVKDIFDWIAQHGEATKLALIGIGTAFTAAKIVKEGLEVQKTIGRIQKDIEGLKGLTKAGKLLESVFGLPPTALAVIAAVTILAAGAYLVITHWTQIKTFFAGLWTSAKNTFSSGVNGIKGIIASIGSVFSGIFGGIKSAFVAGFNVLKTIITPILNGLKFVILSPILLIVDTIIGIFGGGWTKLYMDAVKIFNTLKLGIVTIWNGIALFFTTLWNGIKNVAFLAWTGLKNGVVTIVSGIGTWIVNTFNAVVNWFATLPGNLYSSGVSMFTSFKNGASSIIAGIGVWITNEFNGFVSFFTSLPSKAVTWAHDMIDGFVNGIEGKIDSVKKGAEHIADKIRSILHFSVPDEGPLKPYQNWMPDFVNGMNQGVISTTPTIVQGVTDMATGMTTPISNFVSTNNSLGVSSVQELANGISSQAGSAVSTAQSLASSILQGVKDIFGIHSPSREMFQVGTHFMQGFINSLKGSGVGDVIKKIFGDIASLANGQLGGALSGLVSNFINTGDLKGLGGMFQGVMQNGMSFLSGGGNIGQWIQLAMALTGVSSDWAGPLMEIIQHESGGDPNSINLWDSNAAAGHPSKGLMQLIDENMSDWHLQGMDNIYDPVSNIAAGIRLIKHDYGSVYNVPGIRALAQGRSYVGYATGTNSANKGVAELAEDGAELVTGRQFRNLNGGEHVYTAQETKGLFGGKSVKMVNNFYFKGNVGNEEFFEQAGSYIITKVKTVLDNA